MPTLKKIMAAFCFACKNMCMYIVLCCLFLMTYLTCLRQYLRSDFNEITLSLSSQCQRKCSDTCFAIGCQVTVKACSFYVISISLDLLPCFHVPGHNLDTLARLSLWEAGLDYLHGTGHGVGVFLNVHEGE